MKILKILLFRVKVLLTLYYKNLLSLWKFYLLFSKYWKWFNFLLLLWVMPMDSRIIFELFNALLNETENNETENNETENNETFNKDKLETIFLITVLIFTAVVIYYSFFTGGGEGIDMSGFRRIIPEEPTKFSVNDEGEVFVSLLDEKINIDTTAAGPIVAKHW